jgi:hypothetical protein
MSPNRSKPPAQPTIRRNRNPLTLMDGNGWDFLTHTWYTIPIFQSVADRCPPLILMSYCQLQQYVPYLKRKKTLNNATPSSCSLPFIVYLRGTLPLVIRIWGLLLFSMYLRPLLFYFGFQLNPLLRPLLPLLLVTMCALRLKSEPFSARIIHL